MPKTLERPEVREAPVLPSEVELRPPLREVPPREILPRRRPTRFVRWMGWILVLAVIVLVSAFLVSITTSENAVVDADGSFAANELARMGALESATLDLDGSFVANELTRLGALAPETVVFDGSFAANEMTRLLALTPVSDVSFELNEMTRFMRIVPAG